MPEQVTFGGSDLDRAARLRGDAAALAKLAASPSSGIIVLWRGKPLVTGESGAARLAILHPGHPVLLASAGARVFLGLDGDEGRWALDLSSWEPEEGSAALPGAFLDPSEQTHPGLPAGTRFAELRAVMTQLGAREAELAVTAKAILAWHESHGFCARCGAASQIVMAGWQRTCPACGAHHFPRTDPVVIMLITHGNTVLLGRSPGWPPGMHSLLAGFVEPGETVEAAVRREVWEEAGIRVGRVTFVQSQPWPWPASLMLGCCGEALTREIKIDPVELESAIWVTKERMASIASGGDPEIKPARKGAIAHHLLDMWLSGRLESAW